MNLQAMRKGYQYKASAARLRRLLALQLEAGRRCRWPAWFWLTREHFAEVERLGREPEVGEVGGFPDHPEIGP